MPWKGKMNMNPLLVLLSQTGSTTCVLVPRLWPVEIEAATKATAGAQAIATIAGQAIGAGLTTAADQAIGAGPTTATGLLHAASLATTAGPATGAGPTTAAGLVLVQMHNAQQLHQMHNTYATGMQC